MRWPRLRFTVRRMMIVVAVLALILGGSLESIRLRRYRDECLKRAGTHARWEQSYLARERLSLAMEQSARETADLVEPFLVRKLEERSARLKNRLSERMLEGMDRRTRTHILESERRQAELAEQPKKQAAEKHAEAVRFAEFAAYHTALKRKYLRAAARPWRSVEPDPPPPEPEARGVFWSERGEYDRALAVYEELLRDDPENLGALNNLAWLLATCPEAKLRDGKRAVELAARACQLTLRLSGDLNSSYLDTLAAAHAEAGDFETAVEVQREAIGMLPPEDPNAKGFRDRLEGYTASKPYRDRGQVTE